MVDDCASGEAEDCERGHGDRFGVWEGVYEFWVAHYDFEFAPGELETGSIRLYDEGGVYVPLCCSARNL